MRHHRKRGTFGAGGAFSFFSNKNLAVGEGGALVMPGPLYHNGPLIWSVQALLWGNGVVVLPRFDPARTLELIERDGVTLVGLTNLPALLATNASALYARNVLDFLKLIWAAAIGCSPLPMLSHSNTSK